MKTPILHTLLRGLDYCLGQPLAWVLRQQNRLADGLVAKGLPCRLVTLALLVLNLFVLTSLLFAIIPMWMLFIVLILATTVYSGVDIDFTPPQKEEWRMGIDGYGLYDNQLDLRIDGGNANDDNNPHIN